MNRLSAHVSRYRLLYIPIGIAVLLLVLGLNAIGDEDGGEVKLADAGLNHSGYEELKYIANARNDREWLSALGEGEIVKVAAFHRGLAEKFQVVLRGTGKHAGKEYLAAMKYMERESIDALEWDVIKPSLPGFEEQIDARRADRVIQGWSEVVAFHVDRVLGMHRVAPAVGRRIERWRLFNALDAADAPVSLTAWFFRLFAPEYVDVCVQGWASSLHTTPPELDVFRSLAKPSYAPEKSPAAQLLRDVSDVLVFDYLLDNHDRHRSHNWLSDASRRMLNWDNGLGFNHGPIGKMSCLDLLCGMDDWKSWDRKMTKSRHCTKICRFSNSTVSKLRSVANLGESTSMPQSMYNNTTSILITSTDGPWTLSSQLEKSLRSDALYPHFSYGVYYWDSRRFPKVKFEPREFLLGMDRKVTRFLAHVDTCIAKYGEDWVLMNSER